MSKAEEIAAISDKLFQLVGLRPDDTILCAQLLDAGNKLDRIAYDMRKAEESNSIIQQDDLANEEPHAPAL